MRSESAKIDDAISYAWFTYDGARGKEVSQRTHKKMIRQGDVYGIKPLKNGTRYTLIFPDQIHVDFPLTMKDGLFLIERSKKMRKAPDLTERATRKTAGVKTIERQLARKQFDAPRFAPRKIPVETVNGADFGNYQWRLIEVPNYKIRTTKGTTVLQKNDMVGMRFLKDTRGGILLNQDGLYLKIPTEEYDKIVQETRLLPIQDWPNGNISVQQIKDYRVGIKRAVKRTEAEQREALRLEQRAKVLEKRLNDKQLRKAERDKIAARQAELDKMAQEIADGTREIAQPMPERLSLTQRRKLREQAAIEEEMLEDEVDLDEDLEEEELEPEQQALEDLFSDVSFGADSLGIENALGSLFGDTEDDARDTEVDPLFNMDEVEEPEDDEEEEAPKSKVRSKKKGKKPLKAEAEEDEAEPSEDDDAESEEDAEDDTTDDEDDTSDPDADEEADDSEEDPDAADDEEDPDAEEADAEDDGDDSEEDDADADPDADDSDAEADDSEDPDADAEDDTESDDATDAVDETSGDEEQDDDVKSADDEAAKQAKEYAAKNANTPSSKAAEPEEGDVVRFNADAKLKRDWVILRMSTHKSSDSIVTYTVYDITNSPDEVRQVRINRARKQSLFDIATHVKDMKPALFNQVYDLAENYDLNKDPISS